MFQNRLQAGKELTVKLEKYQGVKSLLVLAIPRGGVVIGKQIATALGCPLDIIITKKIGAPGNEELAVGAIGPAGEVAWNEKLLVDLGLNKQQLEPQVQSSRFKVHSTSLKLRGAGFDLKNKTVILVDDGVATGATMMAAVQIVRQQSPKKLVVAVPVIAKDSLAKIQSLADEVIYLEAPDLFFSVGQFYKEFEQVSDDEVINLLK